MPDVVVIEPYGSLMLQQAFLLIKCIARHPISATVLGFPCYPERQTKYCHGDTCTEQHPLLVLLHIYKSNISYVVELSVEVSVF
jgi:hypothetical protein